MILNPTTGSSGGVKIAYGKIRVPDGETVIVSSELYVKAAVVDMGNIVLIGDGENISADRYSMGVNIKNGIMTLSGRVGGSSAEYAVYLLFG